MSQYTLQWFREHPRQRVGIPGTKETTTPQPKSLAEMLEEDE